ncbi:MAG: efflux RND transporter periplasmic adaptor subunit [Ruminococcaceae bacterium]|nr:efflux RND transporter periplasmic adaptor subunit [Oscillospiraceae bacterium]
MKKKLLAAALAAVMSLSLWGCSNEPETMVYVENVGIIADGGAIAAHDRFAGLVVSENLTEIWRDSAQTVAEIYVEQGQDVNQGELLFAYDSEAMSLSMSKLELERDRLNNLVSTLKTQITALKNEQKKADKDKQLNYTIEIQDREFQLKEAEYNVNAKKKEIEQLRSALSNAKIYAPVSGRVVSVSDSGVDSYGNPTPYITIQQSGSYRIKGTINELNMGLIMEGTPILVSSRTDPNQTWTGVVASMDLESANQNSMNNDYMGAYDEMTSSSSYTFYVDLDSTDGLILGQHVYLELYTEPVTTADGLWLPEYYICQSADGMSYVWANDENDRLVEKYVTLGIYDPNVCAWEILDGLTKEDYIAFPSEYCQSGAHTTKNPDEATTPEAEGTYPQGEVGDLLPEDGMLLPGEGTQATGDGTESTQDTEATGNYSPIQSESTTPEDTTASGGDLR